MSSISISPDELPKPTSDKDVMRKNLDIFGYCIIENAIEKSDLEHLQWRMIEQAEMERALHNHKNPANMDAVNQWVGMLLNKGDEFSG